jgi:hypothetical protein
LAEPGIESATTELNALSLTGVSDGTWYLHVKARDYAGNWGEIDHYMIKIDTAPPTNLSIIINDGVLYTNSSIVGLEVYADDLGSGVYQMLISNSSDFSNAVWEDYNINRDWEFELGDGIKTVYFKVRDRVGKESAVANDTIILDTLPPINLSIIINNNTDYTNTTTVTLTLHAEDNTSETTDISGVYQMQFSNDGTTWTEPQPYTETKTYTLPTPDSLKIIYFRVCDTAGNFATSVSDTITLDTQTPSDLSIIINNEATYTNLTTITLTLSASDNTSGIYQVCFSNDGSNWSDWESYTNKLWSWNIIEYGGTDTDGTKHVYVKIRDYALNEKLSSAENILSRVNLTIESIELSPKNASVNMTVTINATIRNTGNISAYNVSVKFYENSGLIANETIVDVPPGTSFTITAYWEPSETRNYTIQVKVEALGSVEAYVEDNELVTQTFVRLCSIKLECIKCEQNTEPGKSVLYMLNLKNLGNELDTFILTVSEVPEGWTVEVSQSIAELRPGEVKEILVTVTPSESAKSGDKLTIEIRATSQTNPNATQSLELTTLVKKSEAIEFPYIWIAFLLAATIIIIIILAAKKKKSKKKKVKKLKIRKVKKIKIPANLKDKLPPKLKVRKVKSKRDRKIEKV